MNATASTQKLSREGIGASEISAIAGMNPYASPWDIWLRKTGQAPEVEETEAMEWGLRLEPAIRQKYVDATAHHVYVPPRSIFSREREWARATPDGIILDPRAGMEAMADGECWRHLLQIKNVGTWVEKAWSDAPPVYVQLQELWELYVTGLQRADVAVLIGGNDFRVYTVHRDDKAIADLLTIADDFWRRVQARTPPPVDESDACREHFERRFKKADAIELIADEHTERLFAEWQAITIAQKQTKKRVETIRNLIRQQLAEAGASVIKSTLGDAKLSTPKEPTPVSVVNWKHVAELLGSTKCAPAEFAELVGAATATLTPEPKAPTLYAPRNWAKEAT